MVTSLVKIKPKHIFITAAVLAVIVMVVWLVKKLKKSAQEKGAQTIKDSTNQSNLSYELAQYVQFADALEKYLNDKSLRSGLGGAYEKGIYGVMENMENDDDVKQLIVAFGTRKMRKVFDLFSDNYTLTSAIPHFLSKSEVERINEILKSNNVNFKFA